MIWSPSTAGPAERRHIGMVFQDYALWPHMTMVGKALLRTRSRDRDRDRNVAPASGISASADELVEDQPSVARPLPPPSCPRRRLEIATLLA